MKIKVIFDAHELHDFIKKLVAEGHSIGFVPTMGALHDGHLSLIKQSKKENSTTICSIFVNPTQFNDPKDLEKYPRTEEKDVSLLEGANCDIVFIPTVDGIYPDGKTLLSIQFGELEKVMEGEFRPGHFLGMATVVHRLFEIVQPTRAYFGKKDFQQLAIVKEMVAKLKLPIEIIGCETLREEDGLAMSSRNTLLNKDQRKAAPLIYKALCQIETFIPHHSPNGIKDLVVRYIEQSKFLRVQYFELVHPLTLVPIESWDESTTAQACVAVLTEGPRLIDNIEVNWGKP